MSIHDPSYHESDDDRQYMQMIKSIDNLLQRRPPPSPLEFPNKSDIGFITRHLEMIEDQMTLFSHNNNLEFKRLEKHAKLNPRFNDNTFPQHAPSSSSSRRNLTNSQSPMQSYPASSRDRERVKQNAYTPNPYLPKTPTRRRSSKVPTVQAISDEEYDVRSQKKRSRALTQTSGKKPTSRRKFTGTGRQTPESNSGTPTIECTTPIKPVNNRLANIKDNSQASPSSSAFSPLSASSLATDPSATSNLLKVLAQEPTYSFNAPQFHDPRPKPAVQQDFSKAKGTFSVPIQTFQSYSEAYLRPLTQNDLKILDPHGLDYEYLVIPPCTSNSKDSSEEKSKPKSKASEGAGSASQSSDFFTQRLFSALLPVLQNDTAAKNNSDEDEQIIVDEVAPEEAHAKISSGIPNLPSFDARVKHELSLLGLIQADTSPQPQFDEITMQLMRLQTQFKDLNRYNNSKKMRLRKMATDHLAYQDYTRLMDAFDSKLESAYTKRQTAAKSRRKKPSAPVRGVPEGIGLVLEQRSRFCSNVGKVFNAEVLQLPKTSRYENIPCPPSLHEIFAPKGNSATK